MDYKDIFKKQLNQFRSKGYKRTFTSIYRYQDTFPFTKIDLPSEQHKKEGINPDTTIWCSNDYLNMSHNPRVIERMIEVIKEVGTGSGGTRNISGTTPYHDQLEKKLASYHEREAALIFTSAYVANQTTLATICKKIPGIEVFSDQLNHASLIEGIKNSKAPCTIFRHNDLEHLESLLREKDLDQPKIIVFESLYSMDGTETNVSEYVKLAKKYNALTYLDEVHAVGLGYWINGSSDSMGESDLNDLKFFIPNNVSKYSLTHSKAKSKNYELVTTYELKVNDDILKNLQIEDKEYFYWMSPTQFEIITTYYPEILNKNHSSGFGKTYDFLRKRLPNPDEISCFLSYDHWISYYKKESNHE